MSGKIFKRLFLLFIFSALSLATQSELWADSLTGNRGRLGILALHQTKDKQLLLRQADDLDTAAVLRRACDIQRERGLPPVSCFAFVNSESEIVQLTEECERLATKAPLVPALNSYVTESCRKAIESRRLDLRYVKSGWRSARLAAPSDASR